ncbi:hypothetical protein BKA69DRAFT_1070204 [Paraphysoderma sedebokerense]|nr:hypothetical protein BKA69DRAFT_1070192 [Paraphysoderma sedebokerense]KAI9142124.1 hypothetical protein BKA69DRAFT_1070204 [Paraphysoderma sedebokerense]
MKGTKGISPPVLVSSVPDNKYKLVPISQLQNVSLPPSSLKSTHSNTELNDTLANEFSPTNVWSPIASQVSPNFPDLSISSPPKQPTVKNVSDDLDPFIVSPANKTKTTDEWDDLARLDMMLEENLESEQFVLGSAEHDGGERDSWLMEVLNEKEKKSDFLKNNYAMNSKEENAVALRNDDDNYMTPRKIVRPQRNESLYLERPQSSKPTNLKITTSLQSPTRQTNDVRKVSPRLISASPVEMNFPARTVSRTSASTAITIQTLKREEISHPPISKYPAKSSSRITTDNIRRKSLSDAKNVLKKATAMWKNNGKKVPNPPTMKIEHIPKSRSSISVLANYKEPLLDLSRLKGGEVQGVSGEVPSDDADALSLINSYSIRGEDGYLTIKSEDENDTEAFGGIGMIGLPSSRKSEDHIAHDKSVLNSDHEATGYTYQEISFQPKLSSPPKFSERSSYPSPPSSVSTPYTDFIGSINQTTFHSTSVDTPSPVKPLSSPLSNASREALKAQALNLPPPPPRTSSSLHSSPPKHNLPPELKNISGPPTVQLNFYTPPFSRIMDPNHPHLTPSSPSPNRKQPTPSSPSPTPKSPSFLALPTASSSNSLARASSLAEMLTDILYSPRNSSFFEDLTSQLNSVADSQSISNPPDHMHSFSYSSPTPTSHSNSKYFENNEFSPVFNLDFGVELVNSPSDIQSTQFITENQTSQVQREKNQKEKVTKDEAKQTKSIKTSKMEFESMIDNIDNLMKELEIVATHSEE